MLPIRDENPTRRFPIITVGIIGAAVWVFFAVQPVSPEDSTRFLYAEAMIPCEVVTGHPLTIDEITGAPCGTTISPTVFPDKRIWASVVESAFFHGGLAHLLGNMWMLWIFGNNVEERMGRARYAAFYLLGALAAAAAHVLLNPRSVLPVVGASGAIAAVMGAYLVLYPGARVVSIIPPLWFFPFRVPAAVFLVVWFAGQFAISATDPQVAWQAHVGGFVFGMLGAVPLRHRPTLG